MARMLSRDGERLGLLISIKRKELGRSLPHPLLLGSLLPPERSSLRLSRGLLSQKAQLIYFALQQWFSTFLML